MQAAVLFVACSLASLIGAVAGALLAARYLSRSRDAESLVKAISAVLEQLGSHRTVLESMSERLSEIAHMPSQLREDAKAHEAPLTELQRTNASVLERLSQLERSLSNSAEEHRSNQEALRGIRGDLAPLARTVKSISEKLDAAGAATQASAKAATQALEQRLAEREQQSTRVQRDLQDARAKLKAAEQELADLRQKSTEAEAARSAQTSAASSASAGDVLAAIDSDPTLHAGAREALRMLYARFTKKATPK